MQDMQNIPPLIHLGALQNPNCLHHSDFSICARLTSLTRHHDHNLQSARLQALPSSTPFNLSPVEILLTVNGKWQSILSNLCESTILHIAKPSLRTQAQHPHPNGTDASITYLELNESPEEHDNPVIFELDQSLRLINIASLANGFRPSTSFCESVFAKIESPWAKCASLTYQPPKSLFQPHRGRPVDYSTIDTIHNMDTRFERINFFGVVVDCRSASTTRGTDFRSELTIVDESSLFPTEHANRDSMGACMTKIIVFAFERDTNKCLPYRAFGDIVRIHRALTAQYGTSQSNGISSSQAKVVEYSSCLLWRYDDDTLDPIGAKEAIPPPEKDRRRSRSPSTYGAQSSTNSERREHRGCHVLTEYDKQRVSELRKFVKDVLLPRRLDAVRPFLRNVSQVFDVANNHHGMNNKKSTDLICWMKRDVDDCEDGPGGIHVVVSDGPNSEEHENIPRQELHVKSFMSDDHVAYAKGVPFINFIQSWVFRPKLPCWALIKDATIELPSFGDPFVSLSFGRFTSTVFFQDTNAPLVRIFQNMEPIHNNRLVNNDYGYGGGGAEAPVRRGNIPPNLQPTSVNQRAGPGNNFSTTLPASNTNGGGRRTDVAAERWGHQNSSLPSQVEQQQQQQQQRTSQGEQMEQNQRSSCRANGQIDNLQSNNSRKSTPQKRAQPEFCATTNRNDEETPDTLQKSQLQRILNERDDITIVSKVDSSEQRLKPVLLTTVKDEVRKGTQHVNRIKVRGRACLFPRDIAYACCATCVSCNSWVMPTKPEEKSNYVLKCHKTECGKRFESGLDKRLKWKFFIKMMVEDEAGVKLDMWISGNEGAKFLNGVEATCLIEREDVKDEVCRRMTLVMDAGNWLDCCVRGFEYQDEEGCYRIACKMVSTRLLTSHLNV